MLTSNFFCTCRTRCSVYLFVIITVASCPAVILQLMSPPVIPWIRSSIFASAKCLLNMQSVTQISGVGFFFRHSFGCCSRLSLDNMIPFVPVTLGPFYRSLIKATLMFHEIKSLIPYRTPALIYYHGLIIEFRW